MVIKSSPRIIKASGKMNSKSNDFLSLTLTLNLFLRVAKVWIRKILQQFVYLSILFPNWIILFVNWLNLSSCIDFIGLNSSYLEIGLAYGRPSPSDNDKKTYSSVVMLIPYSFIPSFCFFSSRYSNMGLKWLIFSNGSYIFNSAPKSDITYASGINFATDKIIYLLYESFFSFTIVKL